MKRTELLTTKSSIMDKRKVSFVEQKEVLFKRLGRFNKALRLCIEGGYTTGNFANIRPLIYELDGLLSQIHTSTSAPDGVDTKDLLLSASICSAKIEKCFS